MILMDTGPIIALLDTDDSNHTACMATAQRLPPEPLLTTWPCFTEAMYLLGAVGGYRYQAKLWQLWEAKRLVLYDFTSTELERMPLLMEKYRDTPMDLADASLIVLAESLSLKQIFTVDRDFYVYRLADGTALEVIK